MLISDRSRSLGFSLIELSIVLIIIALLSGGLMLGLASQRAHVLESEANQQLDHAREALLGFAIREGRLPCPADPKKNTEIDIEAGKEAFSCVAPCVPPDQQCALEHGALPWQTLGLREVDPWGNRITYFVDKDFSKPLTKEEKNLGVRSRITLQTDGRALILRGGGLPLADTLPAVIISHGNRVFGAYTPAGQKISGATGDELENSEGTNATFVSRTFSDNFDDHVGWIVPNILKSRLVAVGKLP